MKETTGFTKISNMPVKIREIIINRVTVFPIFSEILFLSFLPTACPIETVEPIASPTSITVIRCITCEPMETAVVAETSANCPIINKSAIP